MITDNGYDDSFFPNELLLDVKFATFNVHSHELKMSQQILLFHKSNFVPRSFHAIPTQDLSDIPV